MDHHTKCAQDIANYNQRQENQDGYHYITAESVIGLYNNLETPSDIQDMLDDWETIQSRELFLD